VTRILLVDDHPVVVAGLRQILADSMPDVEFGVAGSAAEALRLFGTTRWHLVVLDVVLPDGSGLDVLKQLRAIRPSTPVLVLSMHAEEVFGVRMLRAGAFGYLTKKAAAKELVTAVRKIRGGGKYISGALAERLAEQIRVDVPMHPHDALSDREYLVFRMLASGQTVKEIAAELRLSPQTVSTHRTRILEKMGLKTNADLVRYVTEHRLMSGGAL
jgi:DNA-binding NarL/FixJ family response regulator